MSKIVYLGPVDSGDPSTTYRLPGDPGEADVVLQRNAEVEVSAAQAKALNADERHRFAAKAPAPSEEEAGPIRGYASMSPEEVIEALGDPRQVPSATVAQAIVDYEKANAKRKTVVEAAEHQVEAFGPAPPAPEETPESANGEKG